MNKFVLFLEEKVSPVAGRLSSQRHMAAIRKGIVATLPLTIVGSFFTILNNPPIQSLADMIAPYQAILDIPNRFTIGILALYATFGIAYSLAQSYKLDGLTSGMLAVMAFLITSVNPIKIAENVEGVIDAGRYMSIGSLSSASLFGSIVTALVSVEIYHFMKSKNISIKLPEGVPPEVSKFFYCTSASSSYYSFILVD